MKVCLIPARGGSKRIPRKNIRDFCGKPMISWAISAAKASNSFDRIIVSTDDNEIASVAKQYGAEVPFMRPSYLSDDHSGTLAVILHAIEWLEENDMTCEAICCLYATSPFVQFDDLRRATCSLAEFRDGTIVFSATSFPFPIQRAVYLDQDGFSYMFNPEFYDVRSQDLIEAYHDAGQFYCASPGTFKSAINMFEGARPLLIPRWRVQDIDNEEDWRCAEILHQLLLTKKYM